MIMDLSELNVYNSLVVVDVETTGLTPSRYGRVCELGAVKIKNGRAVKTFQTLINPQCSISYGASMVNGITDEMVQDAPTFREIALSFENFIEELPIAAYNAPFDVGFLNNEFSISDAHCRIPSERAIDILVLSRRYIRGLRSYALPCVAQALDINPGQAHRALDDAKTAWGILKKLRINITEAAV